MMEARDTARRGDQGKDTEDLSSENLAAGVVDDRPPLEQPIDTDTDTEEEDHE